MSVHKTIADQTVIVSFLKETFSNDVSNFEVIIGGEGSQAYSFNIKTEEYIIRVNKHHTLGFKKDEYVSDHYSSPSIPVPKIFKIGKINEDLRFCISQKVSGKILTSLSNQEIGNLFPELFNVLDAIHAVDVSKTEGYGKWDETGRTKSSSWKQHLLSVDTYAKGTAGMPSLFKTTFLDKDFWDRAYTQMVKLTSFCPEERFLIHGDYGFNNVLSDGKKITGVIDWESSMYGDFLYDIAWLSFWSRNLDY